MNKKINPALIGAFVLASMAMAITAVMYFGASSYGSDKTVYVAYFRVETSGLEVGAPVVLQGVKVGHVTGIDVGYEPSDNSFYVRVEFTTRPKAVLLPEGMQLEPEGERATLAQSLIENGFRARLATQSLVTGKLMLELGFFPGTQANLHTDDKLEIPTIPTTIEKLWQEIATIDFGKIGNGIENIVAGVDRLVNDGDLQQMEIEFVTTLKSLQQAVEEFRKMVVNLDARLEVVAGSLDQAGDGVARLANDLDGHVEPLMQAFHRTIGSADTTLGAATSVLNEADGLLSENSALRTELTQALQNISDAARSLKGFADYLDRHPEALLKGKQ
jgi:paraquat-inducible protein B